MKPWFLSLALPMALAACSANKSAAPAASNPTATTDASLMQGRTLYETHCGTCHPLKKPSARTAEGWKQIVPPMVAKTNKKAGSEILGEAEKEQILKYLIASARPQ